jgi:hypothetical protein
MLTICDKYASNYAIVFNASKPKCLVVLPHSRRFLYDYLRQCSFYIGNNPIDYVDSFVHLGHIISQQLTDGDDILKRWNAFVGQVNDMLCYFRKLKPDVKYIIV